MSTRSLTSTLCGGTPPPQLDQDPTDTCAAPAANPAAAAGRAATAETPTTPAARAANPAAPVARASVSQDQIDLKVAAVDGHFGDGVDVSVMSTSFEEKDWQLTTESKLFGAQLTWAGGHATTSADTFSAKVNYGIHNPDGSVGLNFGASASVVGVETTFSHSGWSLTVGASEGIGPDMSVGVRDQDRDGRGELCGRISIRALTLGACLEVLPALVEPDEPGHSRWEALP